MDTREPDPDTAPPDTSEPKDTAPQKQDSRVKLDTRTPVDTNQLDTGKPATCTPSCKSSETCVDGSCVENVSSGSDGCSDDLAGNLTLQQVAAYQTVKIPLMEKMTAVADRNADVVQGRDTMFRVFVNVGSGWNTRELSARLTLVSEQGTPEVFYNKKSIAASSTDASTANTFQIAVPADKITRGVKYSVQIVECGSANGTAKDVRFPADGEADLDARATGGIKIKIIPLKVGNLLPDTSDTAVEGYIKHLMAQYPIDSVDISIGDTLTVSSPINWTTMLTQVRSKRSQDAPASDVYYFGWVKPAATFREYCAGSCTLGVGYVSTSAYSGTGKAAVGASFADRTSWDTMTHELGHNHGRNHAPCANGGTISGVDTAYPYTKAQLGSWGYDQRTQAFIDPVKSTDLMAYCSNKWLSDYTYQGITDRVAAVNKASHAPQSAVAAGRFRMLLLDEEGPRWGTPSLEDEIPEGTPETATIYDATGAPISTVTVYRTLISDIDAAMVLVPEPHPDWYAVGVDGAIPHPFAAPITVPMP